MKEIVKQSQNTNLHSVRLEKIRVLQEQILLTSLMILIIQKGNNIMQRKIEFRGKRQKDKSWIYGYLIKDTYGHCRIQFDAKQFSQVIIPETIGQFTGLRDKNGVKIYERDIIKRENEIIIVLWNNKYACFTLHCHNWSCLGFFYEDLDVDKVEVIGNTYDNPELLNN